MAFLTFLNQGFDNNLYYKALFKKVQKYKTRAIKYFFQRER